TRPSLQARTTSPWRRGRTMRRRPAAARLHRSDRPRTSSVLSTARRRPGRCCSLLSPLRWLILVFGEIGAEPVEVLLPEGAPIGDPALGEPQRSRLDGARTNPAELLRAHQPAGLG